MMIYLGSLSSWLVNSWSGVEESFELCFRAHAVSEINHSHVIIITFRSTPDDGVMHVIDCMMHTVLPTTIRLDSIPQPAINR